ncbi:patatin-like phospholipase family protein [Flavobacterium psychrophilum]|nr:patatin-like phospholipase family protein [Flavobacterium psychrophilum]
MINNKKIGLSLSGGGYRAAAFHLGTLKKMYDLGILHKVDVISTISGGSITGAAYVLNKESYNDFHNRMKDGLAKNNVITFILTSLIFLRTILVVLGLLFLSVYLTFTEYASYSYLVIVILFVIIFKFQFVIFPVSKVIEKAYDEFFYKGMKLGDLQEKPTLAIGSSNLHTGRPFTFSKNKMSDSDYVFGYPKPILFKPEQFPIARAVMASSCVPFAFTPVKIDQQFYKDINDYDLVEPMLVDGGVYDNQGIQKLTQPGSSYACDIIITSDAGGNFKKNEIYPNTIKLLMRTVDLFMYRIKAFQMQQNIYKNTTTIGKPIAYYSLGWKLEGLIPGFFDNLKKGTILQDVLNAHKLDPLWITNPDQYKPQIIEQLIKNTGYDIIKRNGLTDSEWEIARNVGTNLTSLSVKKIDLLVRHAEDLTEIQLRLYCPFFFR